MNRNRRSVWKYALISFLVLILVAAFYKPNLFQNTTRLLNFFSNFTYSLGIVLINKYACSNQQHYLINKINYCDDEVEKAVVDFLAFRLKEYWVKISEAYLKVNSKSLRRQLRRIVQYICFKYVLCTVVCIGKEEPLWRGRPNR